MTTNRLIEAYKTLLTKIHEAPAQGEKVSQSFWEKIEGNLIKLEHFTEKEAEQIVQSLQRDLSEARQVIKEAGHAIGHWLEWDAAVIENELKQWVEIVADENTIDWIFLQKQWELNNYYCAGELVGIGRVHCIKCGQLFHVKKPELLSDCPHCGGLEFSRDPMH